MCIRDRNSVDFQLSCVGHVTGLIGHLAGESAAVGEAHRLYDKDASARPQLGGRYADVRAQILPLHAPADLEGRVSVFYGTKYLGSFALVDTFTAK